MENKEDLKYLITKIVNTHIWDFRLDESTGSIISFECGEKFEINEGNNKKRKHEGEYSFMIYCSWRICHLDTIITSWNDNITLLKEGVSKLEGLKVLALNINESFDLFIEFEETFRLQVFCDLGINNEFDCNWFFRKNRKYYSINNKGGIDLE